MRDEVFRSTIQVERFKYLLIVCRGIMHSPCKSQLMCSLVCWGAGISQVMDRNLCCTWQRWNVEPEDRVLGATVPWTTILLEGLYIVNFSQGWISHSKECTSLWKSIRPPHAAIIIYNTKLANYSKKVPRSSQQPRRGLVTISSSKLRA